jgi:hypothetical protein
MYAVFHPRSVQLNLEEIISLRLTVLTPSAVLTGGRAAHAQPGAAGPAVRGRVHAAGRREEDADTGGHLQLVRVRWNQHLPAVLVPALAGRSSTPHVFPKDQLLCVTGIFRGLSQETSEGTPFALI